ncbi:MAG TPA: hypothetical protein ENN23_09575 [Deltaproteobacteria bacterium]|nr:hypothetical protein [Deltaproteobacteria bacterium]
MKLMNKEIKNFLNDYLGTKNFELVPINKGGSDRAFFRVIVPDKTSFVFMHYGDEVEENAYWADINKFLAGIGISVPRIIAQDAKMHFILMEDLGDVDLYSQASLPWEKRREFYFQALAQIYRLHSFYLISIPFWLQLAESYGQKLYNWEHQYFLDNFVREVCKINLSSAEIATLFKELDTLSERLQKIQPSLIHRDFQSQNIMIKNGRPVMIDFQGTRRGNLYYDLGSLICDPYVKFTTEERTELIKFYYELMNPACSFDEFVQNFWEASAQRLMQALGAYGFLGSKKGKKEFLGHIDNGLDNLLMAVNNVERLEILGNLATKCRVIVAREK